MRPNKIAAGKATHVYIGQAPCGCYRSVVIDLGDECTGQFVAEMISGGLLVSRLTLAKYREVGLDYPCPHKKDAAK